jgi:hypothetical protein
MKSVLELARECGALAFRDSGGKLLLCGEAQLTAFAARIREEATKEREAMAAVCKAAPYALDVIEMTLHYIKPGTSDASHAKAAWAALRPAIEALDSMQKEGAKG